MLSYRTGEANLRAATAMASYLLKRSLSAERSQLVTQYLGGPVSQDEQYETARVRPDANFELAWLLGVHPSAGVPLKQLRQLLAGRRTDGAAIDGKAKQRGVPSIADVLGLNPKRRLDVRTLARLAGIAGVEVDGDKPDPAPAAQRKAAAKFFLITH